MNSKGNTILCQCNKVGSKKENNLIICNLCNKKQHKECVGSLKEMKPFYICCQCFLDLNDLFLRTIYNYINPFTIKSNIREYKIKFKFKAEEQFNRKNNYIVMRCLFVHHKKYHLKWPEIFKICINDKEVFTYDKSNVHDQNNFCDNLVFSFIEDEDDDNYFTSSNSNLFSVFDYIKKGENTLTFENISSNKVHATLSNSSYYLFTMSLIEIVSYEKFKSTIKEKNDLPFVVRNMVPHPIGNIQEELDITDVYSGTDIIEIPCRGWKCGHIKCFDLKNFLQVQRKARNFVCPYCNQKVGMLYYDGRIKRIIQEIRRESNHNMYLYYINNDYHIIKERKKSLSNPEINVINIEEEISDIDNGESDEIDTNNDIEIQIEQPSSSSSIYEEEKSNHEEINLEEEDEYIKTDFINRKHRNNTSLYEIIDISEDNVSEATKKIYKSDYNIQHPFINKLYKQLLSNYSYCFIYKEDIDSIIGEDNK